MPIPNLRELYGKQYRVSRDPVALSWQDPALHVIVGKSGEVYPHSKTHAGVEVRRRTKALAAMRDRGYPILIDGDDLTTFLVPWDQLAEVLPLIKPRKRRRMSEAHRQACAERLARFRPDTARTASVGAPRHEEGDDGTEG